MRLNVGNNQTAYQTSRASWRVQDIEVSILSLAPDFPLNTVACILCTGILS